MKRPESVEHPDFDTLWDYGKPAETAEKFRGQLEAARDGRDADYLAQLLSQLARTEGLQQRFEAAHTLLDEAESLLPRATAVARVRVLLERGRTFNSSGKRERARPLFEEALTLAREIGHDFHAVDAAHMMEIVADGEEKLGWNARACEIAEASPVARARKWLGSLYNNRGWSLHELERFEEALEVFEKRLAYLETSDPREEQISIARWSIAKTLRLLDRPADALPIQERLLEADDRDGYVFEELGECLLALGREAAARPHFARAHELLSEDAWLTRNESDRLERLKRLGGGA